MNVQKIDLSFRVFTPLKICLVTLTFLSGIILWQYGLLSRKSQIIASLSAENADLKKNLANIDDQLVELRDSASDVRMFQREIIKVMKDIDQNYPVSLADVARTRSHQIADEGFKGMENVLTDANESIFKLSSSQEKLRLESASLLGKAISIKDLLDTTPSMLPVGAGQISSGFGMRSDPFTHERKKHHGLDIRAPIGTSVVASADGVVAIAGEDAELGKHIKLLHKDGYTTVYGHLSSILVRKNDKVKRGKEIGRVGNTGFSTGPHLHFEISKDGRRINPRPYLISVPTTIS